MSNIFDGFTDRDKQLKKVTRYGSYDTMLYRSDLLIHPKRVSWIIKELAPAVQEKFPDFNLDRAVVLALVHDDAEIIIGDLQASRALQMSPEELAKHNQFEAQAIEELAQRWPQTVLGYNYKELLYDALELNTFESLVMKFADKFDAFGEALHEIHGGNYTFNLNMVEDNIRLLSPMEYYTEYFYNFTDKFEKLKPLAQLDLPYFKYPIKKDFGQFAKSRQPHTKESIKGKVDHLHYGLWRELNLKHATDDELREMYEQKEFLD